jgi:hypothetical protein
MRNLLFLSGVRPAMERRGRSVWLHAGTFFTELELTRGG